MLHKKQIIVTPLLSFGILMGGSFVGNSSALAAPMNIGETKQDKEKDLSYRYLKNEIQQVTKNRQQKLQEDREKLIKLYQLIKYDPEIAKEIQKLELLDQQKLQKLEQEQQKLKNKQQ
ncbi:hypothetical protein [Bacillus cereus]|uniref:hypothetical protein n=1 Tax=Bacillus cereus TaxID=1396 RepID=UPI003A80E20E